MSGGSTELSGVNFFFASPDDYQAKRYSRFSPSERDYYGLVRRAAADDVYVYGSHEPSRRPGLYSSPKLSKGYAVAFSGATPLDSLLDSHGSSGENPSLLFSSRWFGNVAVVKVPDAAIPDQMRESDMRGIVHSLGPELHAQPGAEERAQAIISQASHGQSRDSVHWHPSLNGHGHLAGIHKEVVTLATGTARQPNKYYLTVHSDAGQVGDALNQYAATQLNHLTLAQFLRSPQYQAARSYSARNTRRILSKLIDALHLDPHRAHIKRSPDALALDEGFEATPDLVEELFAESKYNYLRPTHGGDNILYYNHTVRLAPSEAPGGRIVQLRNANQGISILQLDGQHDYRAPRFGTLETSERNPYQAFPVGYGRHAVEKHGLGELTPADGRTLLETYGWRQKEGDYSDFATAPRQLYGYRHQDSAGKAIQQYLLAGASRIDLVPVAVLLSDGN
jgi:hypothetical protein